MIDWDELEAIDYHPGTGEARKGWGFRATDVNQKMVPLNIPTEDKKDD